MVQFANKNYYTNLYPGEKTIKKEKTKNISTTWKKKSTNNAMPSQKKKDTNRIS